MTDEFPRGATSTTKVGCRSYVHSEPPRRKGLKISGLLVSRPTAVELMPPQRPRLPIGATLCSARRPPLSIFLATAASPAATTAAAASASTPPFQLLVLRRIAAAADVILVVVQWGGGKASTAAPVATPSWTPSRSSACPPLLLPPKKAPSNHKSPLFCSSFLPLTRSSQSSVCLVSPSCFWAGETWGGKWGTESDSATNSAGERLQSEPAGACGL